MWCHSERWKNMYRSVLRSFFLGNTFESKYYSVQCWKQTNQTWIRNHILAAFNSNTVACRQPDMQLYQTLPSLSTPGDVCCYDHMWQNSTPSRHWIFCHEQNEAQRSLHELQTTNAQQDAKTSDHIGRHAWHVVLYIARSNNSTTVNEGRGVSFKTNHKAMSVFCVYSTKYFQFLFPVDRRTVDWSNEQSAFDLNGNNSA